MTEDEIFAAIGEHVGDDKAKAEDFAKKLRERHRSVAQPLINVGSALKKEEVKADLKKLTEERDAALEAAQEATQALEASNATKPDVAKLEADLTAKWQKKVDDLKKQLSQKDESFRGALKKGSLTKLVNKLVTKYGIDPEYAQEVLTLKYGANVDVRDDASIAYKSADGLEYDGASEDDKLDAFAADIKKTVNPRYVLTNADSGAGVRGGGQGGSGYDPVKEGTEMGKQERAKAADKGLAFT